MQNTQTLYSPVITAPQLEILQARVENLIWLLDNEQEETESFLIHHFSIGRSGLVDLLERLKNSVVVDN